MVMYYRKQKNWSQMIFGITALVVLLSLSGCGDFFEKKSTELETKKTLDELSRIREIPDVNNPLPEIYREPAKKITVKNGVKLFYFTKNHTVDKLVKLTNDQFAKLSTTADGKTIYAPYYSVSGSSATNQLIITCPNDVEAGEVLEFLKMVDVPPIQVSIDCLILERYADVTMDWETTIMVENLLGEGITLGGKADSSDVLLPTFPGASLRESKRSEFGLNFGYWHNQDVEGHRIRAIADLLISKGYLKILMNPTLQTVNGQKAKVTSRENVGLEKVVTDQGRIYSVTDYQWVEDSLEVTPHAFADGSIGLTTNITLGSKSKPEGVVQTSIITERKAEMAENRIAPGDSLVVAGIRKTTKRNVIRGVPFLQDIPILGILFSSKDFEERATEVIFILTPSISSGGIDYAKMAENIRKKYATPEYETGLQEAFTDPFGTKTYTEQIEKEAAQAEFERFKAELDKAAAKGEVEQVKKQLLKTAEEVMGEKAKAMRAHSKALEAQKEAQKAKTEAEEVKKAFLKAQQEAKAAKAAAEAEKANAAKAAAEAEKANAEEKSQEKPKETEKSQQPEENEGKEVQKETEQENPQENGS